MEYRFKPEGVCSKEMIIELDGDIIKSVKIVGGCPGNTVGLTSCPDQLARALENIKHKM